MMAFFVKAIGVSGSNEVPELIILCLGCAIITPILCFLIRLLFISPNRIREDDEAEIETLKTEIESLRTLVLEIEPITFVNARGWHTCQINIHNKKSMKTADDVQVEIIDLADELGTEALTATLRPSFPVRLEPENGQANRINPGGKLVFDLFESAVVSKTPITEDGKIVGTEPFIIQVRFNSGDGLRRELAAFKCGKSYQLKIMATARDFKNTEREFTLLFSAEGESCRFNLSQSNPHL